MWSRTMRNWGKFLYILKNQVNFNKNKKNNQNNIYKIYKNILNYMLYLQKDYTDVKI